MALPDRDSLPTLRPLVRCEPRYRALICLECESAFPITRIARHFRTYHRYPIGLYGSILDSFKHDMLAEDWRDISYPPDWNAPIEGLRVRNGYTCTGCGARTTSDDKSKDHSKCEGAIKPVCLQCWNRTGAKKYWIVTVAGEPRPETANRIRTLSGPFLWVIE